MQPQISIIIVNWKVRPKLEKCLNSILADTREITKEIFVVDNDSRDGTPEMIMAEYPQVTMISLPYNHGFAQANNLAMRQASGKYLFLLILLISLSLVPVSAATNATNVSASTIDAKALSCIQNSIGSGIGSGSGGADKCSSLSVEEQALAVLTTGKCVAALTAKGSDGECWPSSNCELKQTALASLALNSGAFKLALVPGLHMYPTSIRTAVGYPGLWFPVNIDRLS